MVHEKLPLTAMLIIAMAISANAQGTNHTSAHARIVPSSQVRTFDQLIAYYGRSHVVKRPARTERLTVVRPQVTLMVEGKPLQDGKRMVEYIDVENWKGRLIRVYGIRGLLPVPQMGNLEKQNDPYSALEKVQWKELNVLVGHQIGNEEMFFAITGSRGQTPWSSEIWFKQYKLNKVVIWPYHAL